MLFRSKDTLHLLRCSQPTLIQNSQPRVPFGAFLASPKKQQVSDNSIGHLVSLDPGSNPFMTYYSPTKMITGSFGTTEDLNNLRKFQQRYDTTCSLLSADSSPWLPPKDRKRVVTKKLRLYEKVRNRVNECVNKVTKFLVDGFQFIHGSIFEVAQIVERPTFINSEGEQRKGKGRLRSQTRRDILTWRHAPFKKALLNKMELYGGSLVVELSDEAYTTKTCGRCGHQNDVGGSKSYCCKNCGYRVHRDVQGARNHSLKNCVGKYVWVT